MDDYEARIERWRFTAWLLALALFVSLSANLAFYLLLA